MAQRKPDAMSDDDLFADWVDGIQRIYTEMIDLGQNRRMFKMVREVADQNERLRQTGGHVLDWMFGNYALAAAMSFRRDLDRDKSTLGLRNLLHEIADRPMILNRARYRSLWKVRPDDEMERYICDDVFDSFKPKRYPDTPERDHIDSAVVRSDIETLLTQTEKVHLFVEQTYAHRARAAPDMVTWGEVDAAIEALVSVFKKVYAFLTLSSLVSIEPTPQYNTHECFTFPWWTTPDRR